MNGMKVIIMQNHSHFITGVDLQNWDIMGRLSKQDRLQNSCGSAQGLNSSFKFFNRFLKAAFYARQ